MTGDSEPRLKRSTADRYVGEVAERIREVNTHQTYCFAVRRAVVFGSYVNEPGKQMLGDLDVAVLLEPKYEGVDRRFYEDMARERCPKSADDLLWAFWPVEEVLRHIKNRRRYLSIHLMGGADDEAIFSKEWMELTIEPVDEEDIV